MILSKAEILYGYNEGKIAIDPFDEERLTTNSYDLSLGRRLLKYTEEVIDPRKENAFETFDIPKEGYMMQPGEFLLAHTEEVIGSDFFVPLIHGRSGVARLGLFIHVTADLFDIGAHLRSTLQLYATLPVKLRAGMPIAQVSFWTVEGEIELYNGKYKSKEAPIPSLIYRDYDTDEA